MYNLFYIIYCKYTTGVVFMKDIDSKTFIILFYFIFVLIMVGILFYVILITFV